MNKTMTMTGNTALSFGQAIELLKNGKMVTRQGWNGKDLFIFMQIPSIINKDIVPKMQSLPDAVKEQLQKRFDTPSEQIDAIYYSNQLALVNKSNMITGWSPSTSDSLANDWVEVRTLTEEETGSNGNS